MSRGHNSAGGAILHLTIAALIAYAIVKLFTHRQHIESTLRTWASGNVPAPGEARGAGHDASYPPDRQHDPDRQNQP